MSGLSGILFVKYLAWVLTQNKESINANVFSFAKTPYSLF